MRRPHGLHALRFLIPLGLGTALAAAGPVPLLFASDGEQLSADGRLINRVKTGVASEPVVLVQGRTGKGIAGGPKAGCAVQGDLLKFLGVEFTVSAWIRVDTLPSKDGNHWLFSKDDNLGWQAGLAHDARMWLHGSWGGGWYHGPWSNDKVPVGQWFHLASTFKKGGVSSFYVNGQAILSSKTDFAIQPQGAPLQLGRCNWSGVIDDPRVYAAALTPAQVAADSVGTLATRPAVAADVPQPLWPIRARLVRFDQPLPKTGYVYPGRTTAKRAAGPHAVDWPRLRTNTGQVLFADAAAPEATAVIESTLRGSHNLFRETADLGIEPVGHWLRPLNWLWGQQHVYTTDRTARSWGGDYEIWGFPLRIAGNAPGQVRQVELRIGNEVLYQRQETLDSLTLILPASLTEPYQLSVNGMETQILPVALKPIIIGAPVDEVAPVRLDFGSVAAVLPAPRTFYQQKDWDEDQAALAKAGTAAEEAFASDAGRDTAKWEPHRAAIAAINAPQGPARHLNAGAPRSGVDVMMVSMVAGMSGGMKTGTDHIPSYKGPDDQYAAHLAGLGFDRVYEVLNPDGNPIQHARWAAELRARGVRFGANLSGFSHQAQLGNPNNAFYAATLPDWGTNLLRDLHLAAQRFGAGEGAGFFMGADNAGYVPYWDWAPPIPNRPWGRAFAAFQGGSLTHPVGPGCGGTKAHEVRGPQREFIDYIHRYDTTWGNYGRFAAALSEVSPDLPFTIGSFGSSPGVGGRGGWPWASMPGAAIYDRFRVQTAYDWNEVIGTKPLHNLALVDRLRSATPERATWSVVDDFGLCHSPTTLWRDWAVVLSRGLTGVGTNFLVHETDLTVPSQSGGSGIPQSVLDDQQRPDLPALRRSQVEGYRIAAAQTHRLGGSYSRMHATATVGIVYSDAQAISRHLDKSDPEGPHEGKTTEALLLANMAGWPTRLVTTQELKRGLDPEIKALLLVGLNRFDATWAWYDGLEPALRAFVQRGGRIIRDHESESPVDSTATQLRIAAYVKQGSPDQLPWLQHRNRPLVAELRSALAGIPRGGLTCDDDRVWIFPSQADECQFFTVANFAPAPLDGAPAPKMYVNGDAAKAVLSEFRNASRELAPVQAAMTWPTGLVYDVVTGQAVDTTSPLDLGVGARVLVVLPKAPTAPLLKRVADEAGMARITATIPGAAGLPIEVTVRGVSGEATVYGVVGTPLRLPVAATDPGNWSVMCRELASGCSASLDLTVAAPSVAKDGAVRRIGETGLAAFAGRKDRDLVVALTAAQAADPAMAALAERVRAHYAAAGRKVRVGRADPSDVVLHQQAVQPLVRHPRWQTIDADLVLFGTHRDQVLMLDQARGSLLPDGTGPMVIHTWSPFAGLYHAVNIIGSNTDELEQVVEDLLKPLAGSLKR